MIHRYALLVQSVWGRGADMVIQAISNSRCRERELDYYFFFFQRLAKIFTRSRGNMADAGCVITTANFKQHTIMQACRIGNPTNSSSKCCQGGRLPPLRILSWGSCRIYYSCQSIFKLVQMFHHSTSFISSEAGSFQLIKFFSCLNHSGLLLYRCVDIYESLHDAARSSSGPPEGRELLYWVEWWPWRCADSRMVGNFGSAAGRKGNPLVFLFVGLDVASQQPLPLRALHA